MQDIGGLRIVSEADLSKQDEIVTRIVDAFPITKVIDRRRSPTHGYRAVHLIATLDEHLIEIQVRTQLQDLWAQAMERLADEAGREIRYGGAPQKRGEDVENLLNISHECSDRGRTREPKSADHTRASTLSFDAAQVATAYR